MKEKLKKHIYLIIVLATAIISYGYNITHFAIGVDDTATKLFLEDGLSVSTNRWTLFFLNRVLCLNFISWPEWLVELLSVCILTISVSLWCHLMKSILKSVNLKLPDFFYGCAVALAISCPILSEIWVYSFHGGVAIGYGFTALALLCFLQSLSYDKKRSFKIVSVIMSGICLGIAIGCYETMMVCYLIGALFIFVLLHSLSESKKNGTYRIGFLSWFSRGIVTVFISLFMRISIHEILMRAYHLDALAIYGMNDYNPLFGKLFSEPGLLGMLFKKIYLRYFVNAFAYLPITFLVFAWLIIGIWALYFTYKKRDFWIIICVPVMLTVPLLLSIAGGSATTYHSAQYVPIVIMQGAFLVAITVFCLIRKKKAVFTKIFSIVIALGLLLQIFEMNRWFFQDYRKFLEAEKIMTDVAEELTESYDITKPLAVVGAPMPADELCLEACIPLDSWKYKCISALTAFDPTLKEKFHYQSEDGWYYAYTESPFLSVLTWAGSPFENCDLAVSQQYTNFWDMIGYSDFTYVPSEDMIEEAWEIKRSQKLPGYPDNGYIYETEDMIVVNLSADIQ